MRLYCHNNKYFKFLSETLLVCALRKWSSARTHLDLTREFGGCPSRWSRGHKWLVQYIDERHYGLIGPTGLRKWATQFPHFAECLRQYIQRDKERVNHRGHCVLNVAHRHNENEFNVMSLTDCKSCEVNRPGSGPENDDGPSDRRPNWHIKQRAFYDGYHRGMEACVKVLTICLPNGLTAASHGPASSRNDDRAMMRLSEFDECMRDLCMEFFDGDLYCTYGDGIFAGNWYCCRSKHEELGGRELQQWQKDENANLKSARAAVEWSYGKSEQLFPLLTTKRNYKTDQDAAKSFGEIRCMNLFTNFYVCANEGSAMTGERGFRCPPPTLQEYLNMR